MREIKFRGQCIQTNKWLYGSLVKYPDSSYIYEHENLTLGAMKVSQITVESEGQFTGLTDKNGIEIYEDDILTNAVKDNVKVVFKNGSFGILFMGRNSFYTNEKVQLFKPLSDFDVYEIEVIGNVFENSDLLESSTQ